MEKRKGKAVIILIASAPLRASRFAPAVRDTLHFDFALATSALKNRGFANISVTL
jgi:hypothetical protein